VSRLGSETKRARTPSGDGCGGERNGGSAQPLGGSVDRRAAVREKGAGDRQRSKRAIISNMAAAPRDVVASSGRLLAQRNLTRQPELLH
jgi:hypothetical protein